MPDLSEVWSKIGDILTDDATLTAMLSSAGAVYYDEGQMAAAPVPPCLRMWLIDDGPETRLTATGVFRPRVQIDVFGVSETVNAGIVARLDQLLNVPLNRAAGISSTNYLVSNFYRVRAQRLGETGVTDSDGRQVKQVATEWLGTIRPA